MNQAWVENVDLTISITPPRSQVGHVNRYYLARFRSNKNTRAGISQLAWRSNLAMVVLPMGATGPMQVGLQRPEAVRPWQHIFMRWCARVDGDSPEGDGHAGEGSPHAMAAFLVALLASAVMKGVSGNNQVKISTRGSHPDNLSLRAARPPCRQCGRMRTCFLTWRFLRQENPDHVS